MPFLSGPEGDRFVKQLSERYRARLTMLMDNLESPYPYGSEPVSEMEQWMAYRQMMMDPTGESRTAMIAALEHKYAGFPDAHARVEKALQRYFSHMATLTAKFTGPGVIA